MIFFTHDQMKCSPKSQDRALYESLLKQAWSAWRTGYDILIFLILLTTIQQLYKFSQVTSFRVQMHNDCCKLENPACLRVSVFVNFNQNN